ncbi:MAG: RCC1 repeat-containing protein, partial [Verrucomicrobia bacterium]
MGDGTNLERDQIKPVPEFDGVKAVVAGFAHSLALRSDGTVWGWGADMFGQLGNGAPARLPGLPPLPDFGSTLPVQTLDLSDVVAVAAGIFHSLALKADGSTWAWGANSYGQVGDGTTNHQDTPKAVLGLSGARALAGGGFHSLAATADGAVWAWGRNDYGQLGNAVAGAS